MMFLKSIDYSEFEDDDAEWVLKGLALRATNLIVGKNAAGKTRTLNVIAGLAGILGGRLKNIQAGSYRVQFDNDGVSVCYQLRFRNGHVIYEVLSVDENDVLVRGEDGVGRIYASKLDDFIDFQSPTNIIAANARRDKIQHSFLEQLFVWANAVRHYRFGGSLGREHFAVIVPDGPEVNEYDDNQVVGLLRSGIKKFGDRFAQAIVDDMNRLAYDIESVSYGPPVSQIMSIVPPGIVGLLVKERSLRIPTDQFALSQGMFRVVSILIQLNYCLLSHSGAMLIIDDIGEGLDFERSCLLIDLLREKAANGAIQLVMSSNDKFVMNSVPLEDWSVLNRVASTVEVKNIANSRDVFESFKFTGLSNFSFLEMDVATSGECDS